MTTQRLLLAEPPDSSIPTAAPELRETFRVLDVVASGWIVVLSFTTTAPPVLPSQGDAYLVPAGATGDWLGHQNHLAIFTPTGWIFRSPRFGWIAVVADQNAPYGRVLQYSGTAWTGWILPASAVSFDTTTTTFVSTTLQALMVEINARLVADETSIDDHETRIVALEGASGGSGGNVDPDTHPTSADALDEEFEATLDFSTKWSWFRQNSATQTLDKGACVLEVPNAAADNPAAIVQAFTATTWRVRAKVLNYNIASDNRAGILVLEQSSGKCYAFGTYRDAGGAPRFYCNRSAPPAAAANVFVGADNEPGVNSIYTGNNWWYLEIERGATNFTFRVSFSGYDGTFITKGTHGITAYFAGVQSHIGVYHDRVTAAAGGKALIQWFRRMA